MKAKYFNEKEKINIKNLEEIADGIKNGKTVVFPTETVYGIAANALDEIACEKIFKIKNRPDNKALIVLISNYDILEKIVNPVSKLERKLMKAFWPGALTIILEKNKECNISNAVTASKNNIGVRMTSGKIAKLLVEKSGVPIVAPSANLSGSPTGTKIDRIIEELGDRVDYILDCGDIENEKESTIIKVENEKIIILREGKITKEELEKVGPIK